MYADRGPVRARQLAGDLFVVTLAVVIVAAGLQLQGAMTSMSEVGAQLDSSGRAASEGGSRGVDAVAGVPAIGGLLTVPFRALEDAGEQLSFAGVRVDESAATLGWLVPVLLIGLVLGYVAFRYVPHRIRWVREAAEVRRLLDDPDAVRLLAHRAAASRPLRTLQEHTDGAASTTFAAGQWHRLAAAELAALGLVDARLEVPSADVG